MSCKFLFVFALIPVQLTHSFYFVVNFMCKGPVRGYSSRNARELFDTFIMLKHTNVGRSRPVRNRNVFAQQ